MILPALILLPFLGALGAYVHRQAAYRTAWLVIIAVLHTALVGETWVARPDPILGGWIAVDALGLLVLTTVSGLFLVTAIYTVGYLRREDPRGGRAFVSCLLAFLGSASLVSLSHHLGSLWVGMESTTLSVAPLVFHRHDRRSLEAVWKYLVISSVAIALALLGMFFLATAQFSPVDTGRSLVLEDLLDHAPHLNPAWLKAAAVFLLVGFGTKLGLAPMHTWKPDTYGEAPSLVSGLMAGALVSCAFLGIARMVQVTLAAALGDFVRPLLIGFGLVSLAVAAAFLLGQRDVKRLLAYSSVEHVGLLVLGLGLSGVGAYGAVLHVINNAAAKGFMFLAVGNVVLALGTSIAGELRGLVRTLPVSGTLLLIGLLALTGSPPFGSFLSMFIILRAAVDGHPWVAATTALLLAISFVGMAAMILEMTHGAGAADERGQQPGTKAPIRESAWLIAGPVALAAVTLLLGVYLPASLQQALSEAAVSLGGVVP
ncbi:MAG: hypothetical protein HY700_20230 [Gemmatimonadetes bacterium]|nr:hypothetical protein [Gemmatimonadota bacterium]